MYALVKSSRAQRGRASVPCAAHWQPAASDDGCWMCIDWDKLVLLSIQRMPLKKWEADTCKGSAYICDNTNTIYFFKWNTWLWGGCLWRKTRQVQFLVVSALAQAKKNFFRWKIIPFRASAIETMFYTKRETRERRFANPFNKKKKASVAEADKVSIRGITHREHAHLLLCVHLFLFL